MSEVTSGSGGFFKRVFSYCKRAWTEAKASPALMIIAILLGGYMVLDTISDTRDGFRIDELESKITCLRAGADLNAGMIGYDLKLIHEFLSDQEIEFGDRVFLGPEALPPRKTGGRIEQVYVPLGSPEGIKLLNQ